MLLLLTAAGLLPGAAPAPTPRPAAPIAYVAPKPVGSYLAGVIELGANGLNFFTVRLDKQGRWQLEKVTYGRSYVVENMTDPAATGRQVQQYAAQQQAAGVAKANLHVLISSGAAQAMARLAQARTQLYQAIADATGCQQSVFDRDANFSPGYLLLK